MTVLELLKFGALGFGVVVIGYTANGEIAPSPKMPPPGALAQNCTQGFRQETPDHFCFTRTLLDCSGEITFGRLSMGGSIQ
jgi:hypothetical protein